MRVKELKALRVKHDYTQLDCAKLLGISRLTYGVKESGENNFTFDEVLTLLKEWGEVEKINDLID